MIKVGIASVYEKIVDKCYVTSQNQDNKGFPMHGVRSHS